MKFVIVGLGSIGRRHLGNLISLGEKDIVLCRSKLSTLADGELDGFPVETNIEAVLKHKPDAVIISNPTSLHMDAAIPAAQAGCHIFLEKPISNSMERVSELKEALDEGGGQLLVGFQFRFHPTLQILKRLLTEGAIGKAVSVRSHWGEALGDMHPWEDYKKSYAARSDLGGGVVLTLCHPFDYLNWLFGKPGFLWSRTGTIGGLGIDVEDVADVALSFPDGCVGTVHLDYLQKPREHYLEIVGTKGSVRWDDKNDQLMVYKEGALDWEVFLPPESFERNTMFLEQMRHFLAVIYGEAKPICTLDDGVKALEIALKTLK